MELFNIVNNVYKYMQYPLVAKTSLNDVIIEWLYDEYNGENEEKNECTFWGVFIVFEASFFVVIIYFV